jgi:hypothetical protein
VRGEVWSCHKREKLRQESLLHPLLMGRVRGKRTARWRKRECLFGLGGDQVDNRLPLLQLTPPPLNAREENDQ